MLHTTVAITATVPADVAFKVLPLIQAPVVPGFDTLHVTLAFAVAGVTVPVSASGVPASMLFGTPDKPVGSVQAAAILIVKIRFDITTSTLRILHIKVAVKVAVPAVVAVIVVPLTVAAPVALHVMV